MIFITLLGREGFIIFRNEVVWVIKFSAVSLLLVVMMKSFRYRR